MTITDAAIRKAVMRWQKASMRWAECSLNGRAADGTTPEVRKLGSEHMLATIYLQRIGNKLLIESAAKRKRAKR